MNFNHEDKSTLDRSVIDRSNKSEKNDGYKKTKAKKIIYYIVGALEVLFALRLAFKILGANATSVFVSIIYTITDVFLTPFTGIFRTAVTQGIETESVLEPALIIAMLVYALLAWGIDKFVDITNNRNQI